MTLMLSASVMAHPTRAAAQCPVTYDQLVQALKGSVKASGGPGNGGFENHEWAAVVASDGTVCTVAFSGAVADDQWPGSRLIAAEKANTANGLSLRQMALSTANLYASSQPGGPLFGLEVDQPGQPGRGLCWRRSEFRYRHRSDGRKTDRRRGGIRRRPGALRR